MVLLYYPQNTPPRLGRLPMSVLALGAVLEGSYDYRVIDGNVDRSALETILILLRKDPTIDVLAVSVMPGTQLMNAIRECQQIKKLFPRIIIVWGGYFPSMHTEAVLNSRCVDYVIRAQGERTLLEFLDAVRDGSALADIHNLSYREHGAILHSPEHPIYDPNLRPRFPYEVVDMNAYALPTFVGKRTLCHETSVGCPHKCNFCGVVDLFQSRWKAESVDRTIETIRLLKERYGMDGIEFHDSDFFVSEKRVAEVSERLIDERIQWWGEGRIDTLLNYDRSTWKIMERSGLKMIFFGAESGLNETLKLMDKGGVTVEQTKQIAARCREFNITSEFSFVMGSNPVRTEEDIDATIDLMYELERINPRSQMHPFIYTPVPFGTIYDKAVEGGLSYPKNLDEWLQHEWMQYSLRQNPHTPWLTKRLYNKIVNFRAVHQAYYPRLNDKIVSRWKVWLLKVTSAWRYRMKFFSGAYELRFLLRALINPPPRHQGF